MSSIILDTELTADGIVCTHKVLGKVATIWHRADTDRKWFVRPYAMPSYEHGKSFNSLQAAEFYALALAHEMAEA